MWTFLVLAFLPYFAVAEECPELKQCEDAIRATQFFAGGDSLVPAQNGIQVIDDVCSKLPAMTTCMASKMSQCQSDSAMEKSEIFKNIMQWVCTPEGKQVTLDLDKSRCKDDPIFDARFNAVVMGCVWNFQSDLQNAVETKGRALRNDEVCPHIVTLDKCVVDGSREMCGQELALFVDKIWDITTQVSLSDVDCTFSHQIKRRYLEVAMPIIKRAR